MAILKPQITGKYTEKRKNNLLKTKGILRAKYKLSEAHVLHLAFQGTIRLSASVSCAIGKNMRKQQ